MRTRPPIAQPCRNRFGAAIALIICLAAVWPTHAETPSPNQHSSYSGRWVTANFDAIVDIDEPGGGEVDALSAKVIWVFSRSHQDLLGRQLFSDMERQHDGRYKGRIFNPVDGRTYRATLELSDSGRSMRVSGCVGPFCQKQRWYIYSDVHATLPRPRR